MITRNNNTLALMVSRVKSVGRWVILSGLCVLCATMYPNTVANAASSPGVTTLTTGSNTTGSFDLALTGAKVCKVTNADDTTASTYYSDPDSTYTFADATTDISCSLGTTLTILKLEDEETSVSSGFWYIDTNPGSTNDTTVELNSNGFSYTPGDTGCVIARSGDESTDLLTTNLVGTGITDVCSIRWNFTATDHGSMNLTAGTLYTTTMTVKVTAL